MATTDALGTSSPSSSSRFCPSGPVIKVIPVALPPGRLKLVNQSSRDRIEPDHEDNRKVVVAALAASAAGGAGGHDDRDRATDQVGRQRGQSFVLAVGQAILDPHVLPLDEAGFADASSE